MRHLGDAKCFGLPSEREPLDVEENRRELRLFNAFQSVFNGFSLFNQGFYVEQVSSDGTLGRRLQRLDLNQLALQLSPLPVAIAVSYEPLDTITLIYSKKSLLILTYFSLF